MTNCCMGIITGRVWGIRMCDRNTTGRACMLRQCTKYRNRHGFKFHLPQETATSECNLADPSTDILYWRSGRRISFKSRKSQNWWSSWSCVGDWPLPWIGMLQYCRMALATLSLSNEPWGSVLPLTILLVVFTSSSTLPLDWGYATEDSVGFTHHVLSMFWSLKACGGTTIRLDPELSLAGIGNVFCLSWIWVWGKWN